MVELTLDQLDDVSGGGFLMEYVAGKFLDFAIGAVASGSVNYASLVDQSGSSYNMLGA
jgi:hypothetical protein